MQTGFFHSQQMMVTPYKEGPVLTGRNNVASAFFFFLVFGQLFLLPVPSELMQIIHSLISKFRFSRIPKFQKNKRGMTSSVPFELSCRQTARQPGLLLSRQALTGRTFSQDSSFFHVKSQRSASSSSC